jgi:hypothetical protein
MADVPLPRKRPPSSSELKTAAEEAAPKQPLGDTTKACVLGDIIAYDIEGHYIGTKPPFGNEAYLSTKEVVDAHRAGEKVDREGIIATKPPTRYLCTHKNLILLAATTYAEADYLQNNYKEMAGIASVIVRQINARGVTDMAGLMSDQPGYSSAWHHKSERWDLFDTAHPENVDKREKSAAMRMAIKAAINALIGGTDYSNGAYFWDGRDLGTNYTNHPKMKTGFKFTDDSHRIYTVAGAPITDNAVPHARKRGDYSYTYETTAAEGATVFSKFTSEYQTGEPHPTSYK